MIYFVTGLDTAKLIPKLISRSSIMLVKIPAESSFVETEKLILDVYGNEKTRKSQNYCEREEQIWTTYLPACKVSCKAAVIRQCDFSTRIDI